LEAEAAEVLEMLAAAVGLVVIELHIVLLEAEVLPKAN
jgi:hypothetical protein